MAVTVFDDPLTLRESHTRTAVAVTVFDDLLALRESPAPLTCWLLDGLPAWAFSQAMTLTTGGPHGLAAAAGRTPTRESRLRDTARGRPMTSRGSDARRA